MGDEEDFVSVISNHDLIEIIRATRPNTDVYRAAETLLRKRIEKSDRTEFPEVAGTEPEE